MVILVVNGYYFVQGYILCEGLQHSSFFMVIFLQSYAIQQHKCPEKETLSSIFCVGLCCIFRRQKK